MAKLILLNSPVYPRSIIHASLGSCFSFRRQLSSCSYPEVLHPLPFLHFLTRFSTHSEFQRHTRLSSGVFGSPIHAKLGGEVELGEEVRKENGAGDEIDKNYPTGEFEFNERGVLESLSVKLKMLLAFPWERVKKRSVLSMAIRGQVSDQVKSRFSTGLSLPQICENFIKAAYDPRISGVYLHIDSLSCGWAKIEEIRRHILGFKKSGKFVVGFIPTCREKEYYLASACDDLYAPPSAYFSLYGLTVQGSFLKGVLEKVGIDPEIQRIGKYKSAGDQLMRKSLSEENREMLTALLDNIYGNWLDIISSKQGKTNEEIENFINDGVYQVEKLEQDGFISDVLYDDEVQSLLKERLGIPKDKSLNMVDYKKYSRVRKWTLGLSGGKDLIAVIRASGSISRVQSPTSLPGSGIVGEKFIGQIRSVRENKKYKAAIIRIDSPGGDALASDLMWREIRLLSEKIPVVASMSDVAASGGYYMAMAAGVIVAENLTLTGSIGVVTGRFNLEKLYEKIGFNKEIISRGKYAELLPADNRPMRPDEAELFARSAQNAYETFRDKAAISRSMNVDKMEEVAQGRVWTGKDAFSRGLVDAIGGLSRAIAIAKQKANIPVDRKVTLVEVSKPSTSIVEILSGMGSSLVATEFSVKEWLQELSFADGVQARMDGLILQQLEGTSSNPVLSLIRDYLGLH